MRRSLIALVALVAVTLICQQRAFGLDPWMATPPAPSYYAPTGVEIAPAAHYAGGPAVDSSGCACGSCDSPVGCDSPFGCTGRGTGCGCPACRADVLVSRAFGGIEYLNWYNKGTFLPPLVTTNPPPIPAQPLAGVLPTATVLFGGQEFGSNRQSGARITAGMWLDDECQMAAAVKFYGVENGAVRFAAAGNGTTVLGRPFFNTDPAVNREDAILISYPGVSSGFLNMTASNDISGGELYLRTLVDYGRNYRLDLIGGWQYNRIDSDLQMHSQHVQGATTFIFDDVFATENQYNGGTLGLYGEYYHDIVTISAMGKIGLGSMHQEMLIAGNSATIVGGAVTPAVGGLMAQPTNIGAVSRDVLTWSPEVNLKVSYAITQRLSLSVGYTFLYWTRVAFAGDQVDRAVNGTQLNGGALVGPARPAAAFRDSDFWVQTVDLGVSWNY